MVDGIVVGQAVATISVAPYTMTYDSAAHTATGTATGLGGANLNTDLNLSSTVHTNAGTYSDTWTFTDPSGNYQSASGTVTDTINKAVASISVAPYAVTYDGTAHTATGTERAALWAKMVDIYPPYADYQKKTDRQIPIVVLQRV